jgi:hypothetical protein
MPISKKKRKIKARKDTVRVSMTLPEKVYIILKDYAKEDIRSIPQEARYLMELGMQVLAQQDVVEVEGDPEEGSESCIGFKLPPAREDLDYEDE